MTEFLRAAGVIPVVTLAEVNQAVPTARALQDAGITVIEVTFRSPAAAESIACLAEKMIDFSVGAGTVLDLETAKRAVGSGAKFVVAPAFNAQVVEYCLQEQIPVFPGVSSATEIERALSYGLEVVKFFPAESLGGVGAIHSLAAVYPQLSFIPTGGVNVGNLPAYLRNPAVLACGGSWFVAPPLIAAGSYQRISQLSQQALELCCDFSLAHVGVNGQDEDEAQRLADQFGRLFPLGQHDVGRGIFIGQIVEVMKKDGFGRHGHIGIAVNRIEVAKRLMERRGVRFRQDGDFFKTGRLIVSYLEEEIGGFALHLAQRL